jgi:hypothetical protein
MSCEDVGIGFDHATDQEMTFDEPEDGLNRGND